MDRYGALLALYRSFDLLGTNAANGSRWNVHILQGARHGGDDQPRPAPVPPSRYPYYYWSPSVGKVKQMDPYVSSGIVSISDLVRYHVQ